MEKKKWNHMSGTTYDSPKSAWRSRIWSLRSFLTVINCLIWSTATKEESQSVNAHFNHCGHLHFCRMRASLRLPLLRAGTISISWSNPSRMFCRRFCSEAMWLAFFSASVSNSWGAFRLFRSFRGGLSSCNDRFCDELPGDDGCCCASVMGGQKEKEKKKKGTHTKKSGHGNSHDPVSVFSSSAFIRVVQQTVSPDHTVLGHHHHFWLAVR